MLFFPPPLFVLEVLGKGHREIPGFPHSQGPDRVLDLGNGLTVTQHDFIGSAFSGRFPVFQTLDFQRDQIPIHGFLGFHGLPGSSLILESMDDPVHVLFGPLDLGPLDGEPSQAVQLYDRLNIEGNGECQVLLRLVVHLLHLPL